jgi:hypothetical protein
MQELSNAKALQPSYKIIVAREGKKAPNLRVYGLIWRI